MDTSPPFAGSKPSATLELRVDGELRARRPGAPFYPGACPGIRREAPGA